jgi:hypothetical protein
MISPLIKAVYYSRFFWDIDKEYWNCNMRLLNAWTMERYNISDEQLNLYDWLAGILKL